MVEYPQSVPNLTAASTNLYELNKGGNLKVYPDDAMTSSVRRAVAIETTRGWRIAKEKASHKIDVVVALGMAAIGAVQGGQRPKSVPSITRYHEGIGWVSSNDPEGMKAVRARYPDGLQVRGLGDVTSAWLRNG